METKSNQSQTQPSEWKDNYAVYHLDGDVTLVEVTDTRCEFTPFESGSQMVDYCVERDVTVPISNVITETAGRGWRKQFNGRLAEARKERANNTELEARA